MFQFENFLFCLNIFGQNNIPLPNNTPRRVFSGARKGGGRSQDCGIGVYRRAGERPVAQPRHRPAAQRSARPQGSCSRRRGGGDGTVPPSSPLPQTLQSLLASCVVFSEWFPAAMESRGAGSSMGSSLVCCASSADIFFELLQHRFFSTCLFGAGFPFPAFKIAQIRESIPC